MSELLHGREDGEALLSTSSSVVARSSDGQAFPHSGNNVAGNAVCTSPMFSPTRDGEYSDDETNSVGSWVSYGNSDGDDTFLAPPEIEEIPSPRWLPFSPSRRSEPAAINLEEVVVDNEVLDGILEHLLQAAGRKRVWLDETDIRQLCAACGDRTIEPDLRSFLKVCEKLWEALFVKLSKLEKLIQADTKGPLKLDADVDGLTRYAVDELRFACQCWRKLVEAQKKHTNSDAKIHSASSADRYEETTQRFLKDLMNAADLLVEKLKSKSELYKDRSQRYIFLMNNWNHIAIFASSNELPKDWCKILFRGIEQLYHIKYLREAWGELVTWLKAQGPMPPSERVVRERMDSFNKMFEKAVQSQRSLVVSSDGGLRLNLKLLILAQLLQPYRLFVERYLKMEKRTKRLKYTPEDIETVIDGLFGGSEPSLTHGGAGSGRYYDKDAPPGTGTWLSPPFMGVGATGLPSSNYCSDGLNDGNRVDGRNEGENISSPRSPNRVPADTSIFPPEGEASAVAASSETRTDNLWSEAQATIVSEYSVPSSNSQPSAADLGGLEHQDSEDPAEPVNNHLRHQIEEASPQFSEASLDSTSIPLISTKMPQSSLIKAQTPSVVIPPETLPSSSKKRAPHKHGVGEPVLVRRDHEPRERRSRAASKEPNYSRHNFGGRGSEKSSLSQRLHEQESARSVDGDDRTLHYTRPKDWDSDDEVDVTYWEENAEANLQRYWQNTLSAYILGLPTHSVSPDLPTLQQHLQAMWEPMGSIRLISRRHGFFLVCFADKEDMTHALEQGPWLVDGRLLVLRRLSRDRPLDEDRLTSIPLWVKIFGVPLELLDREHLSKFGSRLGFPVCMDAATAAMSHAEYARICVEVPLDFTFPSGITIQSSTGKKDRLFLQYDWRPEACKLCNLLGHEETMCHEFSAPQNERRFHSTFFLSPPTRQ